MYRVRFHLANGPHFMHWQIKNMSTGKVEYVNPEHDCLVMTNCILKNQPRTAQKIFDGADKTVCAWIQCGRWYLQSVHYTREYLADAKMERIRYNPKIVPYWHFMLDGKNIDNNPFCILVTVNRRVYG